MENQPQDQPQNQFQPTPQAPVQPAPVATPMPAETNYGYAAPVVATNPGKGFGIAGIILGVCMMWVAGLPLSIISMVKSKKAQASTTLGIVGLIINILAIISSIVLLFIVIAAYNGLNQRAKDTAEQSKTHSTTSSSTIDLSQSYSVPGKNAYWVFPGTYTGWTMDIFDKNGINRLTRNDGLAYFTSFQGTDNYNQSDLEATRAGLKDYLSVGKGVMTGTESTMTFPQASDGKRVEFIVREYTFDNHGVPSKGIIAARVFDSDQILIVSYTASAATYNVSEWDELSAKMQINDGVY